MLHGTGRRSYGQATGSGLPRCGVGILSSLDARDRNELEVPGLGHVAGDLAALLEAVTPKPRFWQRYEPVGVHSPDATTPKIDFYHGYSICNYFLLYLMDDLFFKIYSRFGYLSLFFGK
jgi:hypothetical protein